MLIFLRKIIQENKCSIYIIPLTIIILIEYFSLHYAQFHYDGFHMGLLLNAAKDLDEGKMIYKDYLYVYGLLNVYLNLLVLKIFDNNIYSLFVVYAQFYILGIVFIYLLSKKFLGSNYALLFITIIFIIHPYLMKPWHNYLVFFLISGYLYLKSFFKIKYDLFSTLILGSIFLFSENFLLTSFLIFMIDLIYSYKIFGRKIIVKKVFIFLLPLFLFFIFLYSNNLTSNWLLHNSIYDVLLKFYWKTDIFSYLFNYLNIIIQSYKNIYSKTTIFFYTIIYLSNIVFIVVNLKKIFRNELNNKSLFILFIAFLNLLLFSQVLANISTFKLATLSSFGFIIILSYIKSIEDLYLKKLSILIIILISLNSFFDQKEDWISDRYHYSENNVKYEKFNFLKSQKYPKTIWKHLEKFDEISLNIKKNCDIQYFANFTDDAYYYYLTRENFQFSQFLYWFRNQERYYQNNFYSSLTKLFDKKFSSRIIDRMNNKNIFFITDAVNKDNIFLIDKNISFKEDFNYIFLPYTSVLGSKVLLLPKNCNIL